MHKLNLKSAGQYRNKKGTLVFRYEVSGSPSALDAYEESQGQYYTVDDKTNAPMFFTPRFAGKTATLVVTDEGKAYVDMSELEQQASLVAQLGGSLGDAMAAEIAKRFSSNYASPQTAERKTANVSDGGADLSK
jgi:hypothetical protein